MPVGVLVYVDDIGIVGWVKMSDWKNWKELREAGERKIYTFNIEKTLKRRWMNG